MRQECHQCLRSRHRQNRMSTAPQAMQPTRSWSRLRLLWARRIPSDNFGVQVWLKPFWQAISVQTGCDAAQSSSLEIDLVCFLSSSGQSATRFQVPGLIAVGQRLAPLSKARTSLSAAQLSPIFLPYTAREGCRTILCAGVPAFKENPPNLLVLAFLCQWI